jgi:hypothetical protein
MSIRRVKASKAAEILAYLKTHARQTTADIAKAVDWTTQRVSATIWAELKREPSYIIRDAIPPTRGRKTPTYVYTHVDYMKPVETTQPGPVETTQPPPAKTMMGIIEEQYPPLRPGPVIAIPPQPQGTLTDFADELARAIAQHVVSRVKQHLETQLQAILPPQKADPTPISIEELTARVTGTAPCKAKAMTVLIAGLLPNQAGIIEKEFGDVFDLRFYMVGENLKQLAAMASNAEQVFTFTSKVSHAVEEVMIGKGHKIHRCSGGMTMLKDQLLKLYMGEL